MCKWISIAIVLSVFTLICVQVGAQCPKVDLNSDCAVDFADLLIFAEQWLETRDYPGQGLAGYWKMDDGPGAGGIADSSQNARHGTMLNIGDSAWVEGKFGTALELDGVDDSVQIEGYKGILGSSPHTCTAWIKTSRPDRDIITWGESVEGGHKWHVVLEAQGRLRVGVGGGNITATTPLTDDVWHHVAIVFAGTMIDDTTFYVDGQVDPVSDVTWQSVNITPGGDVSIGVFAGMQRHFEGLIDEVRIYDRALSADEIARLGRPGGDLDGENGVNTADFAVFAGDWLEKGDASVKINEIHYDPDVKTELVEFVELYNAGTAAADLTNWYFSSGIDYVFSTPMVIGAGGYLVIAQDADGFREKFGFDPDGVFAGRLENDGETVRLRNADGKTADAVDYKLGFPWPTVGEPITENQSGTGYSIQLMNPLFDNDLGGNWGSEQPTPGAANYVVAANVAPQMRQVKHLPKGPKSNESVTITAKVTDSEGVDSVSLRYQVVKPGQYISISDSSYITNWSAPVLMYDDGARSGDVIAGDGVYTGVIPASKQVHRRLIRYRITAVDTTGLSVTGPYADDPCPNFAYFVYDGVPAWTGAINPAVGQPVTYGADVMRSLPVYHFLSLNKDVVDSQHIPYSTTGGYGGSDYRWKGTLIYDGEVYDHIRYRARGGVWRYAMGKNMWKFDFNRGRYFQARDDYGKKYATKWDKLNFSACIQQGNFGHRGEQGMFEAVGFKMFNMMGVEAPKTHWLQFRVIDDAVEYASQYEGDFWGLYLSIEQMDGRFLDEHDLPDGNLYKIQGHNVESGEANNQGPTAVTDLSDHAAFKAVLYGGTNPAEQWWGQTVNLGSYWGYRCVVEGIHHGDIAYGKNYFYYFNPENGICAMLPWDLDLTWANNMYGNGEDPFKNQGAIFSNPALKLEYDNRLREFHDLLYNSDQMSQLIDEFAAIIDPPGAQLGMVDADRAMWDYNPILVSSYVNSSKAGHGRFYQKAATKDFRGMCQIMKDYVLPTTYRKFDSYREDSAMPDTPTIAYTGSVDNPINDLRFDVSAFGDPQGAGTFAAMKWRVAEVESDSVVVEPPVNDDIVLISENSTWRYFKGTGEPAPIQGQWRQPGFDDEPGQNGWLEGVASIGYGESLVRTDLGDMRGNYTTIYLRKTFEVDDPGAIESLRLEVQFDDGFNAWINGTYYDGDNVSAVEKPYNSTADRAIENLSFVSFPRADASAYLVAGTNVIAIQVFNASMSNSSDCFIDARLIGEPPSGQEPPDPPANYGGRQRKYEIEPVWESDEVTTFQNEIAIPASVVRPDRTYRVRVRMKDSTNRWSHWSAPYQFEAGEPIAANILQNLRITEVMYNPAGGDGREFVELTNFGDEPIDMSGVSFDQGITFDFGGPESSISSIDPGGFVLVVRNRADFEAHYGTGLSSIIAGEYGNLPGEPKLSNNGEMVRVVDLWNGTVAEFDYNDARGWPAGADGGGHSLVPLDSAIAGQPDGSCKWGGNWRASTYIDGSPGIDDPAAVAGVVINEVMAHTDYSNPAWPDHDSNDWIELYNAGGDIQLDGDWYLSDDVDDLKKWALPETLLASQSYATFDEITGFHNPIYSGFGLNKASEMVFLSYLPGAAEDRIVDYVDFKGQANFISWGRYPDGAAYWFTLAPTRDAANANPVLGVVISELMYNPPEGNEEYIELYNPTSKSVNLFSSEGPWELDGAVSYVFDAPTSLNAKKRIVIVPFDPAIGPDLDNFNTAYGVTLTAGVDIFGPYSGNLSNGGERLTLEWSEPPDLPNPDTPWIIADEVIYGDYTPWPTSPDGAGDALERISTSPDISGNDPTNWQAAAPSPGQ